ncbi:MAG: hypothetical protein COA42_05810 [Alteromonadaceae bacterium]|nr:MAG: hypothetical protein COA42_05810 [Alteromonadaceae bacterium]
MILQFQANQKGKDYICSDIHGHFSLLDNKLAAVDFNSTADRLFCLGDLIDRGPNSTQALEWLNQPWLHAIQGNHERTLIEFYETQSNSIWQSWMGYGGTWAQTLSREMLKPYYTAFSQLPLAIEIILPNQQRVGLIHAQLPDQCDWGIIRRLLSDARASDINKNQVLSNMLWGRSQTSMSKENRSRIKSVSNIDHVFHGHTIVPEYLTLTNRTFMDLGSYVFNQIGFIEPLGFMQEHLKAT